MSTEPETEAIPGNLKGAAIQTVEDAIFTRELDDLLKDAEAMRMEHMKRAQTRNLAAIACGIVAVLAAGGGFGWFFLMQGTLIKAVACVALALAVPMLLARWAQKPLQDYAARYKTDFLPRMGRLLGGLAFHPTRGISSKILPKTGIVPQHQQYRAEDCFMGTYKGIKIVFSEAHLYVQQKEIFDGIFVLLELAGPHFEGHTIVTSDDAAIKQWRATRWQKFSSVLINNPAYITKFQMFSTNAEKAPDYVGDAFLKELSEMMDMFDNAPISAALFGRKYVFISIPCRANMFEPSHLHMPITTKTHALRCKREIEQIMSIIDILNLYKTE